MYPTLLSLALLSDSADLKGKEANCQILTQFDEMREAFMGFFFLLFILADVGNKEKASRNRSRLDRAALVPT